MDNPLISIIITAYNSSKTIERAMDSAASQTYSNLEIMFIDDCSTDNTVKIINKFIEDHPNIKTQFVKHTKNGGSGMAHRTGHKYAQGEYVQFLDSDDWIDPTFIEDLYKGTENGAIDMVSGGLTYHLHNGDTQITIYHDHIEEGIERITNHFLVHVPYLVNRLIRRSLFEKFPYCINRANEDVATTFPLLYLANKVRFVENPGYHLTQNPTSVMNSLTEIHDLLFRALSIKEYIEFFKDKEEEYRNIFNMYLYIGISRELFGKYTQQQIKDALSNNQKEHNEFLEYLINAQNVVRKLEKERLVNQINNVQ